MKWVTLFSQSGSEIYNLATRLRRPPDIILTNNTSKESWHPGLQDLPSTIIVATSKQIVDILMSYDPTFVTLHGYLRILPAEVVERHDVYNGHPGDIVEYPVLKGKDPQAKAIALKLPSTGVVLHKATAVVDDGEIVARVQRPILAGTNTEQLILDLKALQLDLWQDFLKDKL